MKNNIDKKAFMEDRAEYLKEKKATNTAFILMFPSLITAMIGIIWAPLYASMIVIALSIYGFLMTKKFIEDYYKR